MEVRKFLVTVSGEFDESEFSAKEAIDSAIENEVHDNLESPIWGCDFSVQEMQQLMTLLIENNNKKKQIEILWINRNQIEQTS